jgi:hypothetical protein
MMRTLTQDATLVMRNAVKNGVIDTVLSPFSSPLITNLLCFAGKARKEHRQNPNSFELYQHPVSTSWQEHSFPATNGNPFQGFITAEVARFVVPKGQIGFVQFIEQVVNDVGGNYYATNQDYWGSPTFVIPDVDNIRWWLKLDYYDGTEPPRFNFITPATPYGSEVAPGIPYSEMALIDALWYPAHLNKKIKLIVPGNRMLRFFYYSPPTTIYDWSVRGRLSGYTQSTYSPEAQQNARRLV